MSINKKLQEHVDVISIVVVLLSCLNIAAISQLIKQYWNYYQDSENYYSL